VSFCHTLAKFAAELYAKILLLTSTISITKKQQNDAYTALQKCEDQEECTQLAQSQVAH